MKILAIVLIPTLFACQSIQQKDALLLQDRVERFRPLSKPKYINCQMRTELSASQAVKYRRAFPDEKALMNDWNVTYDWIQHGSRCEVHAHPLTPASANQRAFLDESFCTLMEVFWAHSPFDGLKTSVHDVVDQEGRVFLRQKEGSDLGVYILKDQMMVESRTAHKGVYSALYDQQDAIWRPSELHHETLSFKISIRDIHWSDLAKPESPPTDFWIYVADAGAEQAHTHVLSITCH